MKLLQTLAVAFVLWFANELVDCKKPCSKNQYTIVENGTESCLTCNDCPVGHGLVPPCGSKLKHPPTIECFSCIHGKTYSDEHGPSSCKNCHLCSAHEIVTSACTVNDNTICSNTCEKGYYYENSTHDCQECQDCCHDDKDIIRVEECRRHGMLSNKQCSIHDAKKCKSDFSTTIGTASPVSTTETTIRSTSGITKKPNTGMIVGFSVMGFFIAVLVLVLIFCFRKNKKQSQNVNISFDQAIDVANVEDGAANHLLKDDDDDNDICSIKHMSFEAINKSSNSISEGQIISLSLIICDKLNEDDRGNRDKCDCSFEWKKDGDFIPRNNYQNCNKDLTIQNADVADSGRYYCEIRCGKHPGHKVKSKEVVLCVNPGEGKELKLFEELNWKMEQEIAKYLMNESVGTGNWMDLGIEFGMDQYELKALEKDQAEKVLEAIKSTFPGLTVFEFWKILKNDTMKQNRIAKLLRNDLTKPKQTQTTKAGDVAHRPDSGICEDTDVPLQVKLPTSSTDDGQASKPVKNPALLNLSFVDSSREPSRESSYEDLVHGPFKDKVKNSKSVEEEGSKAKKSRFPLRKQSRESRKSFEVSDDIKDVQEDDTSDVKKWKKPKYSKQKSKDSDGGVENEEYGRERKRSRSSSITSSFKDAAYAMLKQPSSDYSPLDHHHEESDEGV